MCTGRHPTEMLTRLSPPPRAVPACRTEARFGSGHQEADDACRLCADAITTRYAPISSSMMQLLMDTWAGAALL
jgi:hypothetical protein